MLDHTLELVRGMVHDDVLRMQVPSQTSNLLTSQRNPSNWRSNCHHVHVFNDDVLSSACLLRFQHHVSRPVFASAAPRGCCQQVALLRLCGR